VVKHLLQLALFEIAIALTIHLCSGGKPVSIKEAKGRWDDWPLPSA
jgi:hypothetical protein